MWIEDLGNSYIALKASILEARCEFVLKLIDEDRVIKNKEYRTEQVGSANYWHRAIPWLFKREYTDNDLYGACYGKVKSVYGGWMREENLHANRKHVILSLLRMARSVSRDADVYISRSDNDAITPTKVDEL